MHIENSGPSVVFDAKTQEAIEAGKNRVTLLEVETLRLSKLKKVLEGDIVKLEADLVYKTGKAEETEVRLDTLLKEVKIADEKLSEMNSKIENDAMLLAIQHKNVEKREAELTTRLKELQEQATEMAALKDKLTADTTALLADKKDLEDRKEKLQSVLDCV